MISVKLNDFAQFHERSIPQIEAGNHIVWVFKFTRLETEVGDAESKQIHTCKLLG